MYHCSQLATAATRGEQWLDALNFKSITIQHYSHYYNSHTINCHQVVDPRVLCTWEEHLLFIVCFGLILLQFEPVAGDLSSERTRSRELAEKIAKRDPLDVNKVLYKTQLCSLIARNI